MKYNGHKSQLGYLYLNPWCVQREQIEAPQVSVRRSLGAVVDNVRSDRNEPSARTDWLVMTFLYLPLPIVSSAAEYQSE